MYKINSLHSTASVGSFLSPEPSQDTNQPCDSPERTAATGKASTGATSQPSGNAKRERQRRIAVYAVENANGKDYPPSQPVTSRNRLVCGELIVGKAWGIGRGGIALRGVLRGEFTAFDLSTTPPTLLRRDYSLGDLKMLGAKLPKLYFDELENIRGEHDEIVLNSGKI